MPFPNNTDDTIAGDQLKSIVERIERLEEERNTIGDDISDVYKEAKGNGYDTKVLKKVIAIRRRDANELAQEEAILDLYLQAVGSRRSEAESSSSGTNAATRTVGSAKPAEPTQRLPGNEELAYADVKALVLAERNPSPSFVQRRFQITLSRASGFLDRMEAEGLVGPFSNGKREMLVAPTKPIPTAVEMDAAKKLAAVGNVSLEFRGPGNDRVFKRVAAAAEAAGIPVSVAGQPAPEDDPFGN